MGIWNVVKGALVETTPQAEPSFDSSSLDPDEIDYTKPLRPSMPQPTTARTQRGTMAARPVMTMPPMEMGEPINPDSENVVEITTKLSKVAYGSNIALKTFKTLFDSLAMLSPPEVRIQAAVSTALAQGHAKADILKALEQSAMGLDALSKEFVNTLGNEERREVSSRQSRMEQIDAQLVRLQQELQKLQDEKQTVALEVGEKQRKYSEKKAAYEISNDNVTREITELRTALMKSQ